jgi:DNA-binding transcriptional ArsR family regulator
MNDTMAITVLAALSHERRLSIYKLLGRRGLGGMSAGAIAEALDVPPSSLSFHLSQLEQAGLIHSRRDRRQIFYMVSQERLSALIGYLVHEDRTAEMHLQQSA